MKLLADKTGEQFLAIQEENSDNVTVQFIDPFGKLKGKPFRDTLSALFLVGWSKRLTSSAIGLDKFKHGILNDAEVSFALHQLFPLGRKVKLPSGHIVTIASYANTHADGYYMYIKENDELKYLKITPDWEILPSEQLLALPYYPKPLTADELSNIADFDSWAGGY